MIEKTREEREERTKVEHLIFETKEEETEQIHTQ
jgi:hypothetical protein